MNQKIILTDEQTKAKDNLLAFLLDDTKQEIILQGHAGSGKTTLIQEVINEYLNLPLDLLGVNRLNNVIFCATTHKACNALKQTFRNPVWDTKTVHSHFNLMISGMRRYNVILPSQLIIIDECSYIDDTVLNNIRLSIPSSTKIIYMGDKNQLTPVGFNYSAVFYADIPVIELNQTVRQKNAPLIGQFCEHLRECVKTGEFPTFTNNKEVVKLSRTAFETKIKQLKRTDDFKILAFKNSTVDKYNALVLGRKSIEVGDIVINNKNLQNGFNTDEQLTILEKYEDVHREKPVFNYKVSNGHIHRTLTTFKYKKDLKFAMDNHWQTNDYLAELKHHYATTVHKSQGSTYHTVFIDVEDFNNAHDKDSLLRLLYVAFSRATHQVYYVGEL